MKLVRFEGTTTGVLLEGNGPPMVVDVAASLPTFASSDAANAALLEPVFGAGAGPSWLPAIERWAEVGPAFAAFVRAARADAAFTTHPLATVQLTAPMPDPHVRVFALGGNFSSHVSGVADGAGVSDSVANVGREQTPPWGFYVIPGTIVGPDATITPPDFVQKLDYEAEVAAVVGATVRDAAPEDVQIWGYTAWNDFSIRDAVLGLTKDDHGPLTWAVTKNFPSANACGPCMVVDEPLGNLRIRCRVNGEVRQDGTMSEMTFTFGDTAAYLSRFLPLAPGDMIASGTPAGTAMEGGLDGPFLQDGDEVEVEVEGVGTLHSRVVLRVSASA